MSGATLLGFGSGGLIFNILGSRVYKATNDFPTMLRRLSYAYAGLAVLGLGHCTTAGGTHLAAWVVGRARR